MTDPDAPSHYFDHNATTPLCPAAREAWLEAADRFWHNPSSLYREAGAAKRRLEDAREELADRLGCDSPERVVFTSGATEGNQAVMRHAAGSGKKRVFLSDQEHPSLREAAFREFGREGTTEGEFDDERLEDYALVSMMAANNETGLLLPWKDLAASCREVGIPFHTDAAQWIGKLPAADLGAQCDWITGCAHKFGGPKGTGFLVIPEGETANFRWFVGGPQEHGHRAGTEDLPGILAMLAAQREKTDPFLAENRERWQLDRDTFEAALGQRLTGVKFVGRRADRLWNTSMLVLPGAESNLKWLTRLSSRGFSVSTGSACSAGKGAPSHVMAAMGLSPDEMSRVIRVSGGWKTKAGDWMALGEAIADVAGELLGA
jgi:cysteine desulfurase